MKYIHQMMETRGKEANEQEIEREKKKKGRRI
jgi:hypothetical protein